jgi:hypothetical protein
VDVGFGDEEDVYRVANALEGQSNLIIIGSTDVTTDTAKLTRVCDFLNQKGFYFIIYVGYRPMLFPPAGPDSSFVQTASNRWGDKFLGMYIFDEPGGKQLDYPVTSGDKIVPKADNVSDAAIHYVMTINGFQLLYHDYYYDATDTPLFTSDYGLYWFDYLCGYDVVFGEFTGNNSRQLAMAMTRGAGRCLGKDWGVMITWKYMQPPFIEEPDQLYDEMILAYQNGAKYVVVFNSPGNFSATTPYGILSEQHLDTIRRFWDYTKNNPRSEAFLAQSAYVLPRDYGFAFRRVDDNIWGLWSANTTSTQLWIDANRLLEQYGMDLDVVFETKLENIPITLPHDNLIFWNGTRLNR